MIKETELKYTAMRLAELARNIHGDNATEFLAGAMETVVSEKQFRNLLDSLLVQQTKKKRYLISVYYSDWIEADSEEDAVGQMSDQIPYVKRHEWEIVCGDVDEIPK